MFTDFRRDRVLHQWLRIEMFINTNKEQPLNDSMNIWQQLDVLATAVVPTIRWATALVFKKPWTFIHNVSAVQKLVDARG